MSNIDERQRNILYLNHSFTHTMCQNMIEINYFFMQMKFLNYMNNRDFALMFLLVEKYQMSMWTKITKTIYFLIICFNIFFLIRIEISCEKSAMTLVLHLSKKSSIKLSKNTWMTPEAKPISAFLFCLFLNFNLNHFHFIFSVRPWFWKASQFWRRQNAHKRRASN